MKFHRRTAVLGALLLFTTLFSACAHPFASFKERSMMSTGGDMYYDDYAYEESYYSGEMMEAPIDGDMMYDSSATLSEDQKIIKTGSLSLHVEDVQVSVEDIELAATEWGGRVLYRNIYRGESSYTADLQVQVPAEGFDAAMTGLKEMSLYVNNEWTNANDVTEAYMDVESRLSNARAEEQAYLDLLERTGSVTEILEVTRALADVRTEIEYLENDIEYYDTRVAYSTIDVYLTEDESAGVASESWRPGGTVSDAFSDWVVFLQALLDGVIYLAIFGWPFLILGWILWRWLRKDSGKVKGKK